MNVLLKLWSLSDDKATDPYLILPHGYGLTTHEELPESAKIVLRKTVDLMDKFPNAKCLIFSSDYFRVPEEYEGKVKSEEYENKLKKKYLESLGANFKMIEFGPNGICSTMEEVDSANNLYDLRGKEAVSVCDRLHARRVRYIWRRRTRDFSPLDVKVRLACVDGVWTKIMPSFWQQSKMKWLVCNVIGYVATALFGNLVSRVTHKVQ